MTTATTTADPAAAFGADLRQALERLHLTQGQAAERLGLNRRTIVRWIRGMPPAGSPATWPLWIEALERSS